MAFVDSEETKVGSEILAEPQGISLLEEMVELTTEVKNVNKSNITFISKYEPKTLKNVLIDSNNKKKLTNFIKNKHIPNLIITGEHGIGKTTIGRCIAKDVLKLRTLFMEIDVLDEKNSIPITESIENFCRKKVNDSEFKIILFDDIENMTVKLQQFINAMMEKASNVIFIFTSNNLSDILDSIQSKCITIRLDKPNDKEIYDFLVNICKEEKVQFTTTGINSIIYISKNDIRNCLINLQLIINTYNNINDETVYNICNKPQPQLIKKILLSCYEGNMIESFKIIQHMWDIGYSSNDICASMFDGLRNPEFTEIPNAVKRYYMDQIGQTAIIINKGVDTHLQLTACICKLLKK